MTVPGVPALVTGGVLVLVGIVLLVVDGFRAFWSAVDRADHRTTPDLPRAERSRVRRQIAAGSTVAVGRRASVEDEARRLALGGEGLWGQLARVCLFLGPVVAAPTLALAAALALFCVGSVVRLVRSQLWALRGRRWLDANA